MRNSQDLKDVLSYLDASEEEQDYSVIGQFTPQNADGICVYCNHCQPCPKGLNVGMINKYYDLALAGTRWQRDIMINWKSKQVNVFSAVTANHAVRSM